MHFISTDVAVPGLNRDFAYSRPLLVPEPRVVRDFLESTAPLHEQTTKVNGMNKKLRAARDLLLPRLMSGEITRHIHDPKGRWMSVSIGTAKFSNCDVTLVKRHLSTLLERGDRLIADPWPSADRLTGSGRWVWDLYTDERLLQRTIAVYSAALRIYKAMVDKWFGAFRNRLRLNRLMPVRLEGRLTPSHERDATNRGPVLNLRTKSVPVHEKSSVAFDLGPEDRFDIFSYWKDEQTNLGRIRPESATTLAPIVQSHGFHIFCGRPATELAHQWLTDEFQKLGWIEHGYVPP